MGKPVIAISCGDPLGVGPEIVRAALADPSIAGLATIRLFGEERPWTGRKEPRADAGRASYQAVGAAIESVKRGDTHGIVTAPISKEAWHLAGITAYPGHTELLAERFASPRSGMLFVGPTLRVILVSVHVPLREVPRVVTSEKVGRAIELGHEACLQLGVASPRVAVAGLNPHAGEHGLLGDEDERVITPAVNAAREKGIDATGPLPGDTVFRAAANGTFDLVVAMYHDQGLIPVKLLDGYRAVNVTVGLSWNGVPVVRTSPAHGTAFDIAGTGRADPTSMIEAIRLAASLIARAEHDTNE